MKPGDKVRNRFTPDRGVGEVFKVIDAETISVRWPKEDTYFGEEIWHHPNQLVKQ